MKKIIIILILFKSLNSKANYTSVSFWDFAYNPIYGIVDKNIVYCSFENQYWINEWNNKTLGVAINNKEYSVQFQLEQRGNSKFSQNQLLGSYSKSLSPKLKLGIGVQFFFIQQAEIHEFNGLLKPFFGFSYKLDNFNTLFCSISNYEFNPNRSEVPDQINGQWLHYFSKKAKGLISIETGIYNDFNFRISGIFQPHKQLNLCLEVNSTDSPIQFISNWIVKDLEIRLLNGFNQRLGISNQLGLAYSW